MQPHAFVVMPFGRKEARPAAPATAAAAAQPAIAVNFDDVYKWLLQPALVRAGCAPFRADQEAGAGDIRTDMYFELVTADIVVADISILNANVFYELGVRHGVAPRGVFMLHGGWTKRPFDVAPDRTFDYDGTLFAGEPDTAAKDWQARVQAEAERLSVRIKAALDVDRQTIASPVYAQLPGLKPADWSNIQGAKSKYFGEVFADWRARVDVAELNGLPGDILTLAEDAPTRFHKTKLMSHAARALCNMHRFGAALPVLRELLAIDPDHADAQSRLGLVLGRLGRYGDAQVHMRQVVERYKTDPDSEALGILGRVYKDLWRFEWKDEETLADRQRKAAMTSSIVASAVRRYDQAARKKFDFYTGINVVSLATLVEHLKTVTGRQTANTGVTDLATLKAVVRFAAQNAPEDNGEPNVWAKATLGELALIDGQVDEARSHYTEAANAVSTKYFTVTSMLDQVHLFENLGFQPEGAAVVKRDLEERRDDLLEKGGQGTSESKFGKVAICSGHMIDAPGRPTPRFPPEREAVVSDRMRAQLVEWKLGAGDLAVCGGARGADILFAEHCVQLELKVWLLLALPQAEYLERSVRLKASKWEDRFFALLNNPAVQVFQQSERLKEPPKGASVFARNNLWMVNTARVEAPDPSCLYALLVWDEKPGGDGPGGTADCAARVRQLGGHTAIVSPIG